MDLSLTTERCSDHTGNGTVDGRIPAPVEVGSLSHYLQGFSTIPGGQPWDF